MLRPGMLISVVSAPVLDRTGIAGQYTIALQFATPLSGTAADDNLPDVFAAVQQLGFKLEPISDLEKTRRLLDARIGRALQLPGPGTLRRRI